MGSECYLSLGGCKVNPKGGLVLGLIWFGFSASVPCVPLEIVPVPEGKLPAAARAPPPLGSLLCSEKKKRKKKQNIYWRWVCFTESDYHVSEINCCSPCNHSSLWKTVTLDQKGKLFQNQMLQASLLSLLPSLPLSLDLKNKQKK